MNINDHLIYEGKPFFKNIEQTFIWHSERGVNFNEEPWNNTVGSIMNIVYSNTKVDQIILLESTTIDRGDFGKVAMILNDELQDCDINFLNEEIYNILPAYVLFRAFIITGDVFRKYIEHTKLIDTIQ